MDCSIPPAAECIGNTLRTYGTPGLCSAGSCAHPIATEMSCAGGCQAGTCLAAPDAGPTDAGPTDASVTSDGGPNDAGAEVDLTFNQEVYLKASNGMAGAVFGSRGAISADGTTAVIGTPSMLYFYRKTTTGWQETAALADSGNWVELSASGRVAVSTSGRVFQLLGPRWAATQVVASPVASGFTRIAVAADGRTIAFASQERERVFIFVQAAPTYNARQPTLFTQLQEVGPAIAGDAFGASVALDAHGTLLLVGAPLEDSWRADQPNDNSEVDSGAVFAFARSGETFTRSATIKQIRALAGSRFGELIHLAADGSRLAATARSGERIAVLSTYNRQGATFVEGASLPLPANSTVLSRAELSHDGRIAVAGVQTDAGLAGIVSFAESGGMWRASPLLHARNAEMNDGGRVVLAGDGSAVLLLAASEDSASTSIDGNDGSNSALDAGAAFVFRRALPDGNPCLGFQGFKCDGSWLEVPDNGIVVGGVCSYASTNRGVCDGCLDSDGDTFFATTLGCTHAMATDCWDGDANVHPNAPAQDRSHLVVGWDYDCNGRIEFRMGSAAGQEPVIRSSCSDFTPLDRCASGNGYTTYQTAGGLPCGYSLGRCDFEDGIFSDACVRGGLTNAVVYCR